MENKQNVSHPDARRLMAIEAWTPESQPRTPRVAHIGLILCLLRIVVSSLNSTCHSSQKKPFLHLSGHQIHRN